MISIRSFKGFGFIGAVAGSLLTQVACSSGGSVGGELVAVDRSQALTLGEIETVDGTYGAGCDGRSGAWSMSILDTGTNPELTVALNDSDCVLTLTTINTGDGSFSAVPSIAMDTNPSAPSAFGSPVQFYAVASVSTLDFDEDFVVTVLYSDDAALLSESNTAGFAVVASSFAEGSVPAPDYTLSVDDIELLTDAGDIVVSGMGSAVFTEGDVGSIAYVIVAGGGLETYAALETAYEAGMEVPMTGTILWSDFGLLGADLTTPLVRTVIVANSDSGVTSYEAFEITFNPAI